MICCLIETISMPCWRPDLMNPKILRWRAYPQRRRAAASELPPKPENRSAGRKGIFRLIPIAVTTWPEEATRTANSGCVRIAVATVEGGIYTARSRHGVAHELARQLVAAGDLPPP